MEGEPTLSIGEVARSCGVATSALRFWEAEGLISPTGRSAAGYRLYDFEAVARVRFIQRAQALGLSLSEVGELLRAADGQGEQAVRDRLRHFLAHKLAETNQRLQELSEFSRQLERVWARLGSEGPCECSHLGQCSCLPPEVPAGDRMHLAAELEMIANGGCGCCDSCGCTS